MKNRTNGDLVERCSSLGLGYSSRQLCYLQKPHHGLMYAAHSILDILVF